MRAAQGEITEFPFVVDPDQARLVARAGLVENVIEI